MLTRRAALATILAVSRRLCLAENGSRTIEVPARLNRYNQILIPVRVNGSPKLWCLLDSGGADVLYLRSTKAAELGIAPSFAGRSAGAMDASPRVDVRTIVTLDVGNAHLTSQVLVIKEVNSDDGVIGAAVFANSIVEFDYQKPAVRFHPHASFRYQGFGVATSFDLWSNNPQVVGLLTIDDRGPVKARMTVDTGAASGAAYLTPKFNDELQRLGRGLPWVAARFSTCRIGRIAVGQFAMERPVLHLLPNQGFGSDATAPDGVLGMDFLRRYRVFLDYRKRQIILEPNPPHGALQPAAQHIDPGELIKEQTGAGALIQDPDTPVSFRLPDGWVLCKVDRWGDHETTLSFEESGSQVRCSLCYQFPRNPPISLDAETELRQAVQSKARQRWQMNPDYRILANSIDKQVIAGYPAVTYVGEFTVDGQLQHEYTIQILGKATTVELSVIVPAADFEIVIRKIEFVTATLHIL